MTILEDIRKTEIGAQIERFSELHLDDELRGFCLKLCNMLKKNNNLDISRGKPEIWAASIIYVIARLNFLFDKRNEYFLEADTICNFFGTKKSTTGNKATVIEKACNLGMGAEGFCRLEISDMMTVVELDNSMIVPRNMLQDIAQEFAGGEELEKFMAEEKNRRKEESIRQEEQRAEIKRKKAEEKRKEINKNQFDLFGDNG